MPSAAKMVGSGKTIKPLASSLGLIGCFIRGTQEKLSVTALRSQSDANRGVDADRPTSNAIGSAGLGDQAFGQSHGSLPPSSRPLQHRELIASKPSDHIILLERVAHPIGNLAEEFVTCGMSMGIVYVLEPIEVQGQDRVLLSLALQVLGCLRQVLAKGGPVR